MRSVRRSVMRRVTPGVVAFVAAGSASGLVFAGTVAAANGIVHGTPLTRTSVTTVTTTAGHKPSVTSSTSTARDYSVLGVGGVAMGGSIIATVVGAAAGALGSSRRKRTYKLHHGLAV